MSQQPKRLYYVIPSVDHTARILLYATNLEEVALRIDSEGQEATQGQPYIVKDNPVNATIDGEGIKIGYLAQSDVDEWLRQTQESNAAELNRALVLDELTQEAEKLGMYDKPVSVSADKQKAAGYLLRKFDENKLDLTLVEPCVMDAIARVSMYGMRKYSVTMPDGTFVSGRDNWKLAFESSTDVQRYVASAMRHLNQWRRGEKCDPESGLSHLDHLIWNVMLMIYGEELEKERNK